MEKINKYKKEFFYATTLYVIYQFLVIPQIEINRSAFSWLSVLGFFLLVIWIFSQYFEHYQKSISKYSNVLIKYTLHERIYDFCVSPALLYITTILFIYQSREIALKEVIIVLVSVTQFILFVNISKSYDKHRNVPAISRYLFEAIGLMQYYMLISISTYYLGMESVVIVSSLFAFGLLLLNLIGKKQLSITGFVILFVSVIFLTTFAYFARYLNINLFTALVSVAYYVVSSLWNLKLSGHFKFIDYLTPFMFGLMFTLLILTF
jgi:hypothetical protein